MAFEFNALPINYRYTTAQMQSLDILYQYEAVEAQESSFGVVYKYSRDEDLDRDPAQRGFWAWTTQELGNLFPHWSMPRFNIGGPTQQLLNSWGMGFDNMKAEFVHYRRNLFLATADESDPDLFFHAACVDFKEYKRRAKNLLQNPHFSIAGLARHKLPLHWSKNMAETTGTVQLVSSPVLMGSYSVSMLAAPGEVCFLRQTLTPGGAKGSPLTASVWYMSPIDDNTESNRSETSGLFLSVVYADGSAELTSVALDHGTGGEWRRASCTLDLAKELFALHFYVRLNNTGTESIKYYVAAAQLERSPTATPYEDPIATVIPYIRDQVPLYDGPIDVYVDYGTEEATEEIITGAPVTYDSRSGRRLTYIPDEGIFWDRLPPSRCTATLLTVPAPGATQRTTLGWFNSPEDEYFTTSWRVAGNKLEQYNQRIPSEIVAQFDLAEFNLDEEANGQIAVLTDTEKPGFSRTLETLCIHKNLIYLVCKETDDGVTARYLKLINPHSRWPLPLAQEQEISMWLEVLGDVEIPVSSGTCDYVGPIDASPERFLIRIGAEYYTLDFEYDFFMFVPQRRQVVLRTEFDAPVITL